MRSASVVFCFFLFLLHADNRQTKAAVNTYKGVVCWVAVDCGRLFVPYALDVLLLATPSPFVHMKILDGCAPLAKRKKKENAQGGRCFGLVLVPFAGMKLVRDRARLLMKQRMLAKGSHVRHRDLDGHLVG